MEDSIQRRKYALLTTILIVSLKERLSLMQSMISNSTMALFISVQVEIRLSLPVIAFVAGGVKKDNSIIPMQLQF